MLASMAVGVVTAIILLASPAARAWVTESFVFFALAALVPAGAVIAAERLYDVWQRRVTARQNGATPKAAPANASSANDLFLQEFRPDGAQADFDLIDERGESRVPGFSPSADQLGRCLAAYDALLRGPFTGRSMLEHFDLHTANGLCLVYLEGARRSGVPLPPEARSVREAVARVEDWADTMLLPSEEVRGGWRDRLRSIGALLDDMAAAQPSRAR